MNAVLLLLAIEIAATTLAVVLIGVILFAPPGVKQALDRFIETMIFQRR